MTLMPTPEENGRDILSFFKENNIRPNEMLLIQSIRSRWLSQGRRVDDLDLGIQWLIQQGYIETKQDRNPSGALFLTEQGFSEI